MNRLQKLTVGIICAGLVAVLLLLCVAWPVSVVLGTIRINGSYLHYNDFHYTMTEAQAERLNAVLADCFASN